LETTSAIWSGYAGRSVETWRLESFLGLREDRAFYVGQAYDDGEPLLIQLIASDDSPVRAAWEHARSLSHEHLMRVRATGQTDLDGARVAYAVLDLPDDDLGEILGRRTPDASEAVALHTAIAGALDYLHRRGFRHGAIVPSNVFLVRDQVKLAVDSISPASEADQQTDLQQLESLGLPPQPVANETPRQYGRPIAAAAAVAIALVTGYLLIHRQVQPPTPQQMAIPKRQPVVQPPPAARSFAAVRRPSWAVVAATYGNFNGAEKRAAEIRTRARLQAHVFPAAGQGRLYFVVLGSGLSQDAAERLRRHALALGAPRDTYVTKLDES
jgi:hypothetical protein